MKFLKGFLVVLVSYVILALSKVYLSIQVYSTTSIFATGMDLTTALIALLPVTVISGLILWVGRGFLSHIIIKKIFHTQADFKELLNGFGIAHFPLIPMGFVSIITFLFGLSNAGVIASLFFNMFFLLLMYTYFVNALTLSHKTDWKKAILVVFLSEIVILAVLFLTNFIALYPGIQNPFSALTTI